MVIGDYGDVDSSFIVNSFGRSNSFTNSNSIINVGNSNGITSSSNLTVVGQNSNISDNDKVYLANNNNFVVLDNTGALGIGTVNPDGSSLLDVTSTTRGVLFPRMTTTDRNAIISPATGLWIYNTTTNFFNYYDGTTWVVVDSTTGGDVSGSGTTNYAMMWTDGANSVAGDGTWMFSGNDYLPVTTGSNIGDATHRIGTIFMASVFDYSGSLTWYNGTSTTMTLTNAGSLGIS